MEFASNIPLPSIKSSIPASRHEINQLPAFYWLHAISHRRPSNFPSIPHPGNNRRLIRFPPNPMLDPLQGTQFIKLRCVATTIEPCWVKHKKFKNILSNWQFSCSFFGSPVFCHHRASSSLTFLFCTLRRNILHFRWGTVRIMWGFFGLCC